MTTADAMMIDESEEVNINQETANEKIRELEEELDHQFSMYFNLIPTGEEEEVSDDDDEEEPSSVDNEQQQQKIRISFRNYEPRDHQLKKYVKKHAIQSLDEDESTTQKSKRNKVTYYETIEEATEQILQQTVVPIIEQARLSGQNTSDTTLHLIPQKVNYDLKRDVTKKLDILEKRTMKALAEILKEKMSLEEEEDSSSGDDDDDNEEDEGANSELDEEDK